MARIRPAVAHDIPLLVQMGMEFMRTVEPYATLWPSPDEARLSRLAAVMVASPDQDILVSESYGIPQGMIGLAGYEHPLTGQSMTQELFFWVSPLERGRTGIRLLRAAESWARARSSTALQMAAPSSEVSRLYLSLGYEKMETWYYKALVS